LKIIAKKKIMSFRNMLFIFILPGNSVFAQEYKTFNNTLSFGSYIDFTKNGVQPAVWLTYDRKKISVEARYGYDWERNISVYAGPRLNYGNWNIRILQGVTFGNTTGISFSPTTIFDTKKIYIFNQPLYIIGISEMPTNFSHWGELYYKPVKSFWLGITDRFYVDKTGSDFAFGPQLLIIHKNLYITFYWWIPTKLSERTALLAAGYEHEF
jgi:hypothetical protein